MNYYSTQPLVPSQSTMAAKIYQPVTLCVLILPMTSNVTSTCNQEHTSIQTISCVYSAMPHSPPIYTQPTSTETVVTNIYNSMPLTTTHVLIPHVCRQIGRFQIVKVESYGPFRRGRWICHDFLDNSIYEPQQDWTWFENRYILKTEFENIKTKDTEEQNIPSLTYSSNSLPAHTYVTQQAWNMTNRFGLYNCNMSLQNISTTVPDVSPPLQMTNGTSLLQVQTPNRYFQTTTNISCPGKISELQTNYSLIKNWAVGPSLSITSSNIFSQTHQIFAQNNTSYFQNITDVTQSNIYSNPTMMSTSLDYQNQQFIQYNQVYPTCVPTSISIVSNVANVCLASHSQICRNQNHANNYIPKVETTMEKTNFQYIKSNVVYDSLKSQELYNVMMLQTNVPDICYNILPSQFDVTPEDIGSDVCNIINICPTNIQGNKFNQYLGQEQHTIRINEIRYFDQTSTSFETSHISTSLHTLKDSSNVITDTIFQTKLANIFKLNDKQFYNQIIPRTPEYIESFNSLRVHSTLFRNSKQIRGALYKSSKCYRKDEQHQNHTLTKIYNTATNILENKQRSYNMLQDIIEKVPAVNIVDKLLDICDMPRKSSKCEQYFDSLLVKNTFPIQCNSTMLKHITYKASTCNWKYHQDPKYSSSTKHQIDNTHVLRRTKSCTKIKNSMRIKSISKRRWSFPIDDMNKPNSFFRQIYNIKSELGIKKYNEAVFTHCVNKYKQNKDRSVKKTDDLDNGNRISKKLISTKTLSLSEIRNSMNNMRLQYDDVTVNIKEDNAITKDNCNIIKEDIPNKYDESSSHDSTSESVKDISNEKSRLKECNGKYNL